MVEAIGVADARQFIAAQAAASLVKSYAARIDTKHVGGPRHSVLGAAVASELWERIIEEGVLADVWDGGTVRLSPSDLIGGRPAVNITGIGFKASDLDRAIEIRRGAPVRRPAQVKGPAATQQPSTDEPAMASAPGRQRKAPDLTPLHSGALLLTVRQAGAALAKGRTSIYKMIDEGKLERPEGETRVTTDSVRRCAGMIDWPRPRTLFSRGDTWACACSLQ
jgi:hypothetical protein